MDEREIYHIGIHKTAIISTHAWQAWIATAENTYAGSIHSWINEGSSLIRSNYCQLDWFLLVTMPGLERYIKRELGLRISAIVSCYALMNNIIIMHFYFSQVLAVLNIIAAAVCIDGLQKQDLVLPEIGPYAYVNLKVANGWLICFSLMLIIFQIAAIVELFADIKLLKIKFPCGGSLWYLVTIIVSYNTWLSVTLIIVIVLSNNARNFLQAVFSSLGSLGHFSLWQFL